ncbi:hypothetical protein N6L24_11410 [Cognatishimia sp. SS12]|uniref:hypothetical protein n=1 Tax=Cognatishimia sp. SS12 TaxID=2979465 RepID=UPI00232EE894|nr:hypothetical protein [Cognatishimia sp. SS12]MDC0738887.1 hypothetical protein [Cognatishimia sp. SS12]
MRRLLALLPAVLLAALAYGLMLPQQFGAHPWWATQALGIGLLIGGPLALALGTALGDGRAAGIFAGLSLLAFAAARFGQRGFAASYGDDALAGRLWYFGWIALCLALAGLVTSGFLKLTRRTH